MTARVTAVHTSREHSFSKTSVDELTLVAGQGVAGDAHLGARVRHRSRVRADPTQPNLRQVHLLQRELLDEIAGRGFAVRPGELGENVTTEGLALLDLPAGTVLRIGERALVAVTGLRNPCKQNERFRAGLLGEVLTRDEDGRPIRRAGVMGVVVLGGVVRPGDEIEASLPPGPPLRLEPV